MRFFLLSAVLAAGGLLALGPGRAPAQVPGQPGPMTYNQARAYHHFLTSPYSYRALYSTSPGYAEGGPTPFGYAGYYVTPGYSDQRITPHGFQGFYVPPAWGGYSVTRVGVPVLYAPAYGYGVPIPVVPRRSVWP